LFEEKNYLDVARITGKSIGVYIMTEMWIHIAQTYQTKQLISISNRYNRIKCHNFKENSAK